MRIILLFLHSWQIGITLSSAVRIHRHKSFFHIYREYHWFVSRAEIINMCDFSHETRIISYTIAWRWWWCVCVPVAKHISSDYHSIHHAERTTLSFLKSNDEIIWRHQIVWHKNDVSDDKWVSFCQNVNRTTNGDGKWKTKFRLLLHVNFCFSFDLHGYFVLFLVMNMKIYW